MSNKNQILPFATGLGANVLAPQNYAALTALTAQGFQSGKVNSTQFNTVLRQAAFTAAMVAQFTADFGPADVNDDGNLPNYEANFVAALRQLFEGVQFVQDSGGPNAIAVNPQPAATSYSTSMIFVVRVAATNVVTINNGATTISVNGLPPKPLIRTTQAQLLPGDLTQNGLALVAYDGANFELISTPSLPTVGQLWHYGRDSSITVNQLLVAVDSQVLAYGEPLFIATYPAITNTGPTTININNLGAKRVTRGAATDIVAGDIQAATIALFCYDGTEFQLLNPQKLNYGGGGGSGYPPDWNDISGPLRPYWITVNSVGVSVPPSSPTTGDCYLIPSAATGAWSGLGGKVAQWIGASWVYATYPNGSYVSAADTQEVYQKYASGWQLKQIMSMGRIRHYANF